MLAARSALTILVCVATPIGAQLPGVSARAVEDLRVGSEADSQGRFIGVQAVSGSPSGSFVALVRQSEKASLIWFDSVGGRRSARDFALRDGPSDMGANGDTAAVLVGHGDEMELHVFVPGRARPIAQVPLPADVGTRTSVIGWSVGKLLILRVKHGDLRGGRLVARQRPRYEIIRVDPGGLGIETIWSRDDPALHALTTVPSPVGDHVVGTALPWDAVMSITSLPDGFCVSYGLEPLLECTRGATAARDTIRLNVAQQLLTPEVHRGWLAEWRTQTRGRYSDSAFKVIAELTPPATLPIIGRTFGAPDGSIAVARRDSLSSPLRTADSVRIDVVERSGQRRSAFSLPASVQVEAFTGGYIFTTWIDSSKVVARSAETGAPRPLVQIVRFRLNHQEVPQTLETT